MGYKSDQYCHIQSLSVVFEPAYLHDFATDSIALGSTELASRATEHAFAFTSIMRIDVVIGPRLLAVAADGVAGLWCGFFWSLVMSAGGEVASPSLT